MKNAVILKSFSGGIAIVMDKDIPFEELLEAVAVKFREADNFFRNASVAISLEGRTLTDGQERMVLDAITDNSHLNILCLMGKDESKNIKFLGINNNLNFQKDENCGQFYIGTMSNGQSIETENSIIILGDVEKGCSIYSNKDIVVLGSLMGNAYAGAGGSNNHMVVALNMNPYSLRIGECEYIKPPERSKRKHLFKKTKQPQAVAQIAYTYNGEILVKPITKELLDNFTL